MGGHHGDAGAKANNKTNNIKTRQFGDAGVPDTEGPQNGQTYFSIDYMTICCQDEQAEAPTSLVIANRGGRRYFFPRYGGQRHPVRPALIGGNHSIDWESTSGGAVVLGHHGLNTLRKTQSLIALSILWSPSSVSDMIAISSA